MWLVMGFAWVVELAHFRGSQLRLVPCFMGGLQVAFAKAEQSSSGSSACCLRIFLLFTFLSRAIKKAMFRQNILAPSA